MVAADDRYALTKGRSRRSITSSLDSGCSRRAGLDVGRGTGRHADDSPTCIQGHGVDISRRFIALATQAAVPLATFHADARSMAFELEFDAVICLCQGVFGMMTGTATTAQSSAEGLAR